MYRWTDLLYISFALNICATFEDKRFACVSPNLASGTNIFYNFKRKEKLHTEGTLNMVFIAFLDKNNFR